MKTKLVRSALAHWEGGDSFVAHHDNLLNTNRIGRARLPSRGGSYYANFAAAKRMAVRRTEWMPANLMDTCKKRAHSCPLC